jgi:hypothetical protein
MIDRFEIIDVNAARPAADRIIFCDGAGGDLYRAERDLELSHWRPNRTPPRYRAGTSTEICFRFLDHPRPGPWTIAVNNHVDVDGILSVYVLVESRHALEHRRTIIEAAEMGDFWGWGDSAAQRVFQGITRVMDRLSDGDRRAVYLESFRRIPAFIDGTDAEAADLDASLEPLRRGIELVTRQEIRRSQIAERLALYELPRVIAGDDDTRAAYVPEFNEAISPSAILWPHARAHWDAERACIVSTSRDNGWFHDLWFPGYLWADTEDRWIVPGLTYHDGMASYDLENEQLVAAFAELQGQEPAPGSWALSGTSLPFSSELQPRFPLVGRFVDGAGRPACSELTPRRVASALEHVFDK